jgi:hypothetical protein
MKCLISCLSNFFSLWWWAQVNSSTAPLVAVGREALLGHWIFISNTSRRTAKLCVVAIWSLWLTPQKGNIFNPNCSLDIKLQKFDARVKDGRPDGWIVFLAFTWHILTNKNSQLFIWCTARHILCMYVCMYVNMHVSTRQLYTYRRQAIKSCPQAVLKAYVAAELLLHSFLTSALEVNGLPCGTRWRVNGMDTRAGLKVLKKTLSHLHNI